ncbi:hypothetical protein CfE428DRAFT_5547 [Chthoniobacter flavus Ellin428]|uniref:Uncharacterized protein n=1 Tax=Chthoniobacter flavus Ellin428 TaxID=497964 RepID=B4D9F7_9BACT|nr:DUF4043 family protein [Chthoniobacter flavus]EDY16918.1 hypothetical protein CfE428DRAFT_5547 [Chthoniobacter flavus Ellin428]TCO87799.1 uncharacterized protein DUF4043 [Chthoniobacter flavus]
MKHLITRAGITLGAALLVSPAGWLATLTVALLAAFINPCAYGYVGMANIAAVAGSTKTQIIGSAAHDEEVAWEMKVGVIAAASSPFADNMTGAPGSGKPIIVKNDFSKLRGTTINITTVDQLGGPVVGGNAARTGNEEAVSPGDFQLVVDLGFFPVAIDNTGKSQTVIGAEWDDISQELLAVRIAKQQSDDAMQDLKCEATSDNLILPNGKTIDTLGTADVFSTSVIEKSGGRLHDLGAIPFDARTTTMKDQMHGRINRYLQFTSQQNARPLKGDSVWQEAAKFAKERGDKNPLFTGEYYEYDNNVLYPWHVIQHGAIGSIGAALQPDALLGTAIAAKGTSITLPTAATIDGGGSTAKATATPLRNFFEFFSLYAYSPINRVSRTYNARPTGYTSPLGNSLGNKGFFVIIDSVTGLASFFSYTGNNGNTLTGVVRLGSTTTGDYNQNVGDVSWNTGAWLTTADGAGFLGVSEGAIAAGSKIYETNSKGVPLGYGFGMGEMALVCGYGRIALPGNSFAKGIHRTEWVMPHNQAFSKGIETCYGTAAFKRPDGKTPNYTLNVFARKIDGFPVIA